MLHQFEAVLDTQDPAAIESAREMLLKALDDLEGQSYL